MGSRGSGSRGVLRHHGIQHRPQKRGLLSSSNRKWGKPAAFLPVVTIRAGVHAVVRPCSWVFSSPALLFKRFQTSWESIDRGTSARESWWKGSGDCSRGRQKGEALRWTLQVLQEREDLRDDYRELVKLGHHFPRWCPSRWNSIPCSWSNAPGQMDVKVLYSFKIWMFRGQFRLTKKEDRGLQRLCLFVVRVYAKAWI
ncbi:hypothetical protein GWK47_036956 [Chionoecetes opilio]|uniref:Uncharacterized protein n=1 Tax=Chionoecetes opilio TaxID=41210 RepID=A0A8J5D1M6_CHIOP|nr:hypothetical protein GWK47_036956 [Chionoecetes opilio]